jgi:GT2 family glycosyltransferase
MPKKPEVSVIYVFYSGLEDLIESIRSFKETTNSPHEIIVVNNSKIDIKQKLKAAGKEIKYIKTTKNLGYGGGNNLGAKHAKGKYLFFLNPDTLIKPNAVKNLVKFLESNKKAAVAAPNLLTKKGTLFDKMGTGELTPKTALFALTFIDRIWPGNPISKKYYLMDKPKNKLREVGSVPGSAFMITKKVFDQINGFDENFFLYFEENDLGQRIKKTGYKIFITPKAEVVHKWTSSKSSKKLKKIFVQSRFYYFKKHFGLLKGAFVEFFLRLGKYELLFILLLLLAIAFRIYNSLTITQITGEIGDNLLDIKNHWFDKTIPLRGPPTSHPWLDFGPLFYWIYGPILVFFDFDPASHAYFGAVVSILTVLFNFIYISKLLNKRIALLSSGLIAFSPFYLSWGHFARFFTLDLLFIYPYIYFSYKFLKSGKKGFLSGLFMGIMLNFHLTPLILIPPTFIALFYYQRSRFIDLVVKYLSGIFLTSIPLLIADSLRGFEMTNKFILWIPYRIAGFVGLVPKNNIDQFVLRNNLYSFYEFITDVFVFDNNTIKLVLFVLFIISFISLFKKVFISYKNNIFWTFILLIVITGYLALFIHGSPPAHYYIPIAFTPLLIVSKFTTEIKNKNLKLLILTLLIITLISNATLYVNRYESANLSYLNKLNLVENIVEDADEQSFSIQRIGVDDHFEGSFAQDYQYLLWWKGNEPVKVGDQQINTQKPRLHYIIVETNDNPGGDLIYDVEEFKVYKKNLD